MRVRHEVIRWHRATFPNATKKAILAKLSEECLELINAIDSGHDESLIVEEMADVRIVMESFFRHKKDSSLDKVTMRKLAVNKKRAWGKETSEGDRPRVK